jgi:hypothetical protein
VEPSVDTPATSPESVMPIEGEAESPDSDFDDSLSGAEARIAALQRDIENATEEEITVLRRLETERTRRIALERELHSARDQAGVLLLEEATRAAEASIAQAEDEASRIIGAALDEAAAVVAEAEEKSRAVVEHERELLQAFEADAERRIAELEYREVDLIDRLTDMQRIYDDLQDTLRVVAERSIDRLIDAKHSVGRLEEQDRTSLG